MRWPALFLSVFSVLLSPEAGGRSHRLRATQPEIVPPIADEPTLDLEDLVRQLESSERAPARELLGGYRIRYQPIYPDRLLIQVESRGRLKASQREAMLRTIRGQADRARQIALDQGGRSVKVSVWLDGQEL